MNKINLYLQLFVLLLIFPIQSYSAEGQSAQEFMAVSKITGACGILDSMLQFQKTTKMLGGNEFVSRFWATEAARLGLSMQQYSDQCNSAITTYDKLWAVLEENKK
ncbi:MAG: hypothetical protein OQK98_08405 [Gammaproteobacteria bacterium]|nr:hypothetical protein [Gammaproteobacteria bacterium]